MTKYERHIKQLCKMHGIKIHHVDRRFCCNIYLKEIWIRRQIRTVKSYITALHEIGHIINESPHKYKNIWRDAWEMRRNKKVNFTTKYTLKKEIDAWITAFSIAKWKMTAPASGKFAYGISTYLQSYNECHKNPISIDYVLNRFQKGLK